MPLKPATIQTAALKCGILGFQGSGKTYTASRFAAGLVKYSKIEKPVIAFYDTEKSSDFLVDYYRQQGITFLVEKSRTFKGLVDTIAEAEKAGVHAFIVDSVTHVWRELMRSYQVKYNRRHGLSFSDWAPLKEEWGQFTDRFINSPMHFFALGRAGYIFDEEVNEETGKKSLIKAGTKMKAEGEFGYESDLLLEMELLQDPRTEKAINRAWVIKDRWDEINGKHFDFPKFEDFLPVIKRLAIGTDHHGFKDGSSEEIWSNPDFSVVEAKKERDIALDELQTVLTKLDLDGTSADAKKRRIAALESAFGTASKTAIEQLWAPQIRDGIAKLKAESSKEAAA